MRQTTTAKVRFEAGKPARFSALAQSTDWFDPCCARGARFTVAHDGRRGDPWPHNHAGSGECRVNKRPCDHELKPDALTLVADKPGEPYQAVIFSDGMRDGGPLSFTIPR